MITIKPSDSVYAAAEPTRLQRITGLRLRIGSRSAPWSVDYVFMSALLVVLTGYAFLGKGFAYIGAGGFYVAEVVVLLAIAVIIWHRTWYPMLKQPAGWLLVALCAWGAIWTVPHLWSQPYDAMRDAAVLGYALVGFAAGAAMLHKREALWRGMRWIAWLGPVILILMVPLLMLFIASESPPTWFGGQPILWVKPGDQLVLVAGLCVFWLAGVARWRAWIAWPITLAFLMPALVNRGGLLACLLALLVAGLLLCQSRSTRKRLLWLLLAVCTVQASLSIIQPQWTYQRSAQQALTQPVSFHTLLTRVVATMSPAWRDRVPLSASIPSDPHNGDDEGYLEATMQSTLRWRLDWWSDIVRETTTADRWYRGLGFGVNLANHYGYQVMADDSLRSPHNIHMALLARAGYPALLLWLAMLVAWKWTVLRAVLRCRQRGQHHRARILVFLLACWLAMLVNATFDVYIEGPVGGLWFWTVYGFGLAAAIRWGDGVRAAAKPREGDRALLATT